MASNKTPNLNLDVWAETDYFKRAELNNNFMKLDERSKDNIDRIESLQEDVVGQLAGKANKKKTDSWVDIVADYGAKGDGLTDDTNAFNACFSESSNRNIRIPAGTYLVEYVHFTKSVNLLGDGFDKTIIKRKNNYNTTTFDTKQPKKGNILGNTMYDYSTKENVSIDGICFDGNVSTAIMNSSPLLNMFNNVQLHFLGSLLIRNCKFINSIGDGLYLGGIDNAIIESCYFEHIGYNISASASSRNGVSTFGTYFNSSVSQNLLKESNTTIKNCFFKDSADMGIVTRNPKSLTVENCEFNSIANSSLELYGDGAAGSTKNNTFENKFIIRNNLFSSGNITHGDSNKSYREVLIFEGNIVRIPGKQLSILGTNTDFDVTVRNNYLELDQLRFDGVKNVNLDTNTIRQTNSVGVYFGNCLYPIVTKNKTTYTGASTSTIAVQFYNTTVEPIVEGNTFSSTIQSTSQCIYFNFTDMSTSKCDNLRIIGNKISGYNRGVNISIGVGNTILINSNIIDVPVGGDYCVYHWATLGAKKAIMTGNILMNNTNITLNATTKVTSGNV